MKWKFFFTLCICLSGCNENSSDAPYVDISNSLIKAKVYLPDAEKGYYRGTRFDWSGNIPSLEYKGHQYFGQWFPVYDPLLHDAICGPVENFTDIGFQQAEVGGEFLRIGVGGLLKEDNSRFNNFKLYPISNPGKWTIKKSKNQVVFIHEIKDVAGYSYHYTKAVRLTEGKPELVLEHTLKNKGKKAIKTDVYNHNFFTIDNEPTGPNVMIHFPFEVSGRWNRDESPVIIEGKSFRYPRLFEPNETVFMGDMQGHSRSVKDYDFRIENRRTGAGVRITCDRPISKINYWASSTTSCPEPFIDIDVPPGEQFTWTIKYEFYEIR